MLNELESMPALTTNYIAHVRPMSNEINESFVYMKKKTNVVVD